MRALCRWLVVGGDGRGSLPWPDSSGFRTDAKWRLVFDLIFNRPTKGQTMYSSDPIWDGRCHVRLPTWVLLSMHCELPDISAVVPPIRWTEIFEDVYFSFCG
jgi:hypothetical protein